MSDGKKSVASWLTTVAAALSVFTLINTKIILPIVRDDTVEIFEKKIASAIDDAIPAILIRASDRTWKTLEEHARHPHPEAVSRKEFDMVVDRLESLQKSVATKESVANLQAGLRRIEARLDSLNR